MKATMLMLVIAIASCTEARTPTTEGPRTLTSEVEGYTVTTIEDSTNYVTVVRAQDGALVASLQAPLDLSLAEVSAPGWISPLQISPSTSGNSCGDLDPLECMTNLAVAIYEIKNGRVPSYNSGGCWPGDGMSCKNWHYCCLFGWVICKD
jgi:hypothetical protein